jgi:hypothetical protein
MSGDLEGDAAGAFIRATGCARIAKPFELAELKQVVLGDDSTAGPT